MATTAMWVPGTAASVELNSSGKNIDVAGLSWSATLGLRQNGAAKYRCQSNATYTFHFPIPTPVILNGKRAKFVRAVAFYNAPSGVTLQKVEVFDGILPVLSMVGLTGTGDHIPSLSDFVNGVTVFPIQHNDVFWGVDLALTFHFASDQNLTLYTAGVDFDV